MSGTFIDIKHFSSTIESVLFTCYFPNLYATFQLYYGERTFYLLFPKFVCNISALLWRAYFLPAISQICLQHFSSTMESVLFTCYFPNLSATFQLCYGERTFYLLFPKFVCNISALLWRAYFLPAISQICLQHFST